MLLDYKIAQIMSQELQITSKMNQRLHTQLKIKGKADMSYMLIVHMIFSLFNTYSLTHNLKLELYKKLLHLLRYFEIIYKIPDDRFSVNPVLFWGVGAKALSNAQLQSQLFTSQQTFTSDISFTYTTSSQVFYFAYPQSIGLLSSILDPDEDETFPDWTRRSEMFTILGYGSIPYYVYEFNNLNSNSNFLIKFLL
jgi:hypothetical protein